MSAAAERSHPLDRPVWNALHTGWSHLAQSNGSAVRLDADIGPFIGVADTSEQSIAALGQLIPRDGEVWLVEGDPALAYLPDTNIIRQTELAQMVAQEILGETRAFDIVPLGEDDAADMLALATLTKPGPFARHTNRLSQFIGIKDEGRLVAMCGERMRVPGYAEVSGLCTHPDYQGRGYGATLMRTVSRRILERGEQVFLHAYAANSATIALYESIGFSTRRIMAMSVIGPDLTAT